MGRAGSNKKAPFTDSHRCIGKKSLMNRVLEFKSICIVIYIPISTFKINEAFDLTPNLLLIFPT